MENTDVGRSLRDGLSPSVEPLLVPASIPSSVQLTGVSRWASGGFTGARIILAGLQFEPPEDFEVEGAIVADAAILEDRTEFLLVDHPEEQPIETSAANLLKALSDLRASQYEANPT